MSVPTLQSIYEEISAKKVACRIIIGGAPLTHWDSVEFQFQVGQVPTATITIPGRQFLPNAVAEEASVQIWMGFVSGVALQEKLVFGGGIVDSVSNNDGEVVIECVMDGPRKLNYSYNRRIIYDFEAVLASDAVADLMDLAGVQNYVVDLDPWVIGTAVPQTLEFSTYGEAINKIAEVDGTPWYAMPTGQVRVEKRDPIPSPTPRRIYFSGVLTGPIETQPLMTLGMGNPNPDAQPRILSIDRRKYRGDVANWIEVAGAVVVSLGPNGEQNSEQILETVDGVSGQFPNGAYWIPTPPLYQQFTFSDELIDTNAKAFEVATRYFDLKNRLFEKISLPIPGDPDVFLGSTVGIVDPNYSGVTSLYFVEGYSTRLDSSGFETQLQLSGGPEAGTVGYAAPFAEFYWKYTVQHEIIGGGQSNQSFLTLPPATDLSDKLCEDIPFEIDLPDIGADFPIDKRTVFIGLDGTASQDFDGHIVSYEWSWTDISLVEHTSTGPRKTLVFDPDVYSSIQVTLTVTDNSGRTDSITKTIYTSADYLDPTLPANDPSLNDTGDGGGIGFGACCDPEIEPCGDPDDPQPPPGGNDDIPGGGGGGDGGGTQSPGRCNGVGVGYYIAAGEYMMGSLDNRTWNDLAKGDVGVSGDFKVVAGGVRYSDSRPIGLFGTDAGEVVETSDVCVSGQLVFQVPSGAEILQLILDGEKMGTPLQGENSPDGVPVYDSNNPGTLTIRQAYDQALAVGFDPQPAVIAVAIMMGESGLRSDASNSAGNTPPSTDRGIAQFNSYWHPEVSDTCAYNTACAIREMYRVSSGGSDYTQWAVYTAGVYKKYLSQVQDAVGVKGDLGDEGGPVIPRAMKAWLTTSAGEIFTSEDGGASWDLYKKFADGQPIHKIITNSRLALAGVPALAVFGGSTSQRGTLIRLASGTQGEFVSLSFDGDIKDFIDSNAGLSIVTAILGRTALLIAFSDGSVWLSTDPISNPSSWYEATGVTGIINDAVPGFEGEILLAGDDGVFRTEDDAAFTLASSPASPINQLVWQGLPGKYLAAADGGLYTTLDHGGQWGFLRPSTEFGTTWPVGAVGYQAAFAVGPRDGGNCEPACEIVGYTVAAWNSETAAQASFDGFTTDESVFNVGLNQAVTDAVNGDYASFPFLRIGTNDTTPISELLVGSFNVTEVGSQVVFAIASRSASGETPGIPVIGSEHLSDWKVVDTVIFGPDSRLTVIMGQFAGLVATISDATISFQGQMQEAVTYIVRQLLDTGVFQSSSIGVGKPSADESATEIEIPTQGSLVTWVIDPAVSNHDAGAIGLAICDDGGFITPPATASEWQAVFARINLDGDEVGDFWQRVAWVVRRTTALGAPTGTDIDVTLIGADDDIGVSYYLIRPQSSDAFLNDAALGWQYIADGNINEGTPVVIDLVFDTQYASQEVSNPPGFDVEFALTSNQSLESTKDAFFGYSAWASSPTPTSTSKMRYGASVPVDAGDEYTIGPKDQPTLSLTIGYFRDSEGSNLSLRTVYLNVTTMRLRLP